MTRMRLPFVSLAIALAGSMFLPAPAEADGVSRGALLASMCNTCHGPSGGGSKSISALNNLDAEEIIDTMTAFQAGEEDATIMDRHATGYSAEDIKALAEHYASGE